MIAPTTPEFPLLELVSGQIQLKPLRHGQSRLERCNPESTAVGAHALQRPVVKVWSGAPPLSGRPSSLLKRLSNEGPAPLRPALGEEGQVLPVGANRNVRQTCSTKSLARSFRDCSPDTPCNWWHRTVPRWGHPDREGSLRLAVGFHLSSALGEVPADRTLVGILRRNGSRSCATRPCPAQATAEPTPKPVNLTSRLSYQA